MSQKKTALLALYTEAEQKGVKSLILDLTENGGENEQVWIEYIAQPNLLSKNQRPLAKSGGRFWCCPAGI